MGLNYSINSMGQSASAGRRRIGIPVAQTLATGLPRNSAVSSRSCAARIRGAHSSQAPKRIEFSEATGAIMSWVGCPNAVTRRTLARRKIFRRSVLQRQPPKRGFGFKGELAGARPGQGGWRPPIRGLPSCGIFATPGKSFSPVTLQIGFPAPLSRSYNRRRRGE